MDVSNQQQQAVIAAASCVSAAAALHTFHHEGPDGYHAFGLDDPMHDLASATARVLDIEHAHGLAHPEMVKPADREANDQLRAAIRKWQLDTGAGET